MIPFDFILILVFFKLGYSFNCSQISNGSQINVTDFILNCNQSLINNLVINEESSLICNNITYNLDLNLTSFNSTITIQNSTIYQCKNISISAYNLNLQDIQIVMSFGQKPNKQDYDHNQQQLHSFDGEEIQFLNLNSNSQILGSIQYLNAPSQCIFLAENMQILPNSKFLCDFIAFYNNNTNSNQQLFNFDSVQINSNQTFCADSQINSFQSTNATQFLNYSFNNQTNLTTISISIDIQNTTLLQYFSKILSQQYSILIIVQQGSIILQNSTIFGSKIGIYGGTLTIDQYSVINTTGQSCLINQGVGKGPNFISSYQCMGAGASHGGYGGSGLPFNYTQPGSQSLECIRLLTTSIYVFDLFPYNQVQGGSGGAFQTILPNNDSAVQMGRGGGVIILVGCQNLSINGKVLSQGTNSLISYYTDGEIDYIGGGGSGGSIVLISQFSQGTGEISTQGGNSNIGNQAIQGLGGEGSGGIIKINSLNWNVQNQDTPYFLGSVLSSPGQRNISSQFNLFRATNGMTITTFCPPGYFINANLSSSIQCMPCRANYYKESLYGQCKQCIDSQYSTNSESNNSPGQCYKYCDTLICNVMMYYTNVLTDYTGVIIYIFYIMILVSGYIMRRLYRLRHVRQSSMPFDFENATETVRQYDKIITEELKQSKDFEIADLLYHVHRIWINGSNCIYLEWFLDPEPPEELEYLLIKDEYYKFVQRFNKYTRWGKRETLGYLLLMFFYYPLYWLLITRKRKQVWKKVKTFVTNYESYKFLKSSLYDGNQSIIKMKLSKSIDYTQCYLDIMNYQTANLKFMYIQQPYIIYLSGVGAYLRPFYINEEDPFIKSLYFAINRKRNIPQNEERQKIMEHLVNTKKRVENSQKLKGFFKKFNKYAQCVDFGSPKKIFYHSVKSLVDEINYWNLGYFQQFDIRLELLIIQTPKISLQQSQKTITIIERRSDDDTKFREFLNKVHDTKIYDSLIDIKFALYIFNTQQDPNEVQDIMQKNRVLLQPENQNSQSMYESVIGDGSNSRSSDVFGQFSQTDKNVEQLKGDLLLQYDLSTKSQQKTFLKKFFRGSDYYRYFFFSHRPIKGYSYCNKYLVIYLQTIFTLIDSILNILLFINLYYAFADKTLTEEIVFFFVPYPFAILISPILGLVLVSSQSYGIAKLYFVFNQMSFISVSLCFLVQAFMNYPQSLKIVKLVISIVKFIISQLGCLSICYTVKLSKLNQNIKN